MKKNKHITINLEDDLYNNIIYIANIERRKPTEYLYLLVADEINKCILNYVNRGGSDYKPLEYK